MMVLDKEIRFLEEIGDNKDQVLVLSLDVDGVSSIDGEELAYENCSEHFSFVSVEEANKPQYISIAKGLGGDFWFTDIQRMWRPDHPGIQLLASYFDQLEDVIWDRTICPDGTMNEGTSPCTHEQLYGWMNN